jgi:hypothetical protein
MTKQIPESKFQKFDSINTFFSAAITQLKEANKEMKVILNELEKSVGASL